jgi:RimJ/RimL family protein N-acetyltransferase
MSTAMPVLETERLRVRPFTEADLDAVNRVQNAAWEEDVAIGEREKWLRWTVASYENLAALMQPPYGDRAVELKESGELVGVAGLVPSFGPFGMLPSFGGDREATMLRPEMGLYWAIDPAHQGRGYATEAGGALVRFAFDTLGLEVIVATTEHDNLRSQAVMRKLGMSLERNPGTEPPWFQVCAVLFNPAAKRAGSRH